MERKKILVTSIGGDVACAALRCLREKRDCYELIGCDINEYAQGQMYVDNFMISPRYADEQAYITFIQEACLRERVHFFLPIGEPEIVIAARPEMRDFFQKNDITPVIVNDEIIATATDKYKTYELCRRIGVPSPDTVRVSELTDVQSLPFTLPAVLKKVSGCGSKGLRRLQTADELQTVLDDSSYAQDWIVQKEVGNVDEEYTMGVFSDGENVSSITFQRWLGYGSMSVRVRTVDEPQCREIAEKLAKALELYGSINVQMRKENGVFYVFEINPRLSSSCGFRHLNGFCDAQWWIALLDHQKPDISFTPMAGKVGIKILDDMLL